MLCGLLSLILVGDVYSQFKLREVDVELNVQTIVSVNVDPLSGAAPPGTGRSSDRDQKQNGSGSKARYKS